jgi:hypothetical protein
LMGTIAPTTVQHAPTRSRGNLTATGGGSIERLVEPLSLVPKGPGRTKGVESHV